MAKRSSSTDRKVSAAFHEVYHKVPKTVKATGKTGKAKTAMMRAIAFSKARAAGADIPEMQRGGIVPATGVYNVHKNERVLPAGYSGPFLNQPKDQMAQMPPMEVPSA